MHLLMTSFKNQLQYYLIIVIEHSRQQQNRHLEEKKVRDSFFCTHSSIGYLCWIGLMSTAFDSPVSRMDSLETQKNLSPSKLFVRCITGQVLEQEMNLSSSLHDLKKVLASSLKIPDPSAIALSFRGFTLCEELRSLEAIGLFPGAILDLNLNMKSGLVSLRVWSCLITSHHSRSLLCHCISCLNRCRPSLVVQPPPQLRNLLRTSLHCSPNGLWLFPSRTTEKRWAFRSTQPRQHQRLPPHYPLSHLFIKIWKLILMSSPLSSVKASCFIEACL